MSGNPFDPFGGGIAAAAPSYGTPAVSAYGTPSSMNPLPQDQQAYGIPQPPQQQQAYGTPQPPQQQQAYDTPQPPQQQQQQYAAMMQQQQQLQYPGNQQSYPMQQQQQQVATPVADPWGVQPQPPSQQQQPAYGQQQAYTQDPWGSQPQQQEATQVPTSPAASAYDPFAASPAPSNQMVLSQQQSNPYGSIVAQAPAPTGYDYGYASQSLVPSTPQASPWGVPQNQPYGVQSPAANYDPFAAPAPPPAPVPPPTAIVPAPAPQVYQENPFGDFPAPMPEPTPPPAPAPAPAPAPPQEVQIVASQERQLQQYSSDSYSRRESEPSSRAIVPASPRNPYAGEIARRAPPGASPLPKAELVKKSGYVLSRISFRTIVMKKWKQSYWVQYGSHTMLWFRTQSDFDDWLNNPYHTQAQRNFLIKLAVNFVHDLYKPNVRGYQVTQCRIKPYGNKMVRQFKLERWMDYGPTIAAAFGSYDPKEVDALREAIVECMRNTPLENGVRATGAVRQGHNEGRGYNERGDHRGDSRSQYHERSSTASHQEERNPRHISGAASYTQPTNSSPKVPPAARSVVSTADLLDDHNHFDDTASLPATSGAALVPAVMPQAYPGAPQQVYQQQVYQQAPPQPQYQQQQQYQEYQQYQQPAPQAAAPQQYQQQYQQPAPQPVTPQQYGQQYQQQYQQVPQQQYAYQQQQAYPSSYPGQAPQY